MHNQPREPQPYEDCQAKLIQEFGWTSQGIDWGWSQGIKSLFLQSVMIWSTMSSAGVGPSFFLKTNGTRLPIHFGALHSSFCWPALLSWFHFPAGFGTCPHCQKHQKLVKWTWCWCAWMASKLTRPEPHRESIGCCQEENEKQETKNANELKATVKETWASIPPQQCHKLITSMPRRIEAVIKAKGAHTKYWVHIQ